MRDKADDRKLKRIRELEARLAAIESGAATLIPTILLTNLEALNHIAVYGIRRPDDLGYVKGQHPQSSGTRNPNRAHYQLSLIVKELEGLGRRVQSVNEQLDPGVKVSSEYAVETLHPGLDRMDAA